VVYNLAKRAVSAQWGHASDLAYLFKRLLRSVSDLPARGELHPLKINLQFEHPKHPP
jgi:hypothetical protein